LKQLLKKILSSLGIYVSKNQKYDALLEKILEQELSPDSNCVDVGSHVGEILDLFLKYSPQGKHIGFEPIPRLAEALKFKYTPEVIIKPYGLSNSQGEKDFTHVKNAEAFSGFKERDYQNRDVDLNTITVQTATLDEVLKDENLNSTSLIKIDVEGAELEVLEGAYHTISSLKPLVIFEHGKGAADYYKTSPKQVFNFFIERCNMKINTLDGYLDRENTLDETAFEECFNSGADYYFIAHS